MVFIIENAFYTLGVLKDKRCPSHTLGHLFVSILLQNDLTILSLHRANRRVVKTLFPILNSDKNAYQIGILSID